jgi:hypothetical protein
MKCPKCHTKLTRHNLVATGTQKETYRCPNCGTESRPRFSVTFFVVFFLFVAPVLEFLIRAVSEPILVSLASNGTLGRVPPRAISFALTGAAMVVLFLLLNRLKAVDDGSVGAKT